MGRLASDRPVATPPGSPALARLCAVGFLAYCSYAICRTPLLPLFAAGLGADPPTVGVVVGASTVTGILLKLPAGAWSDVLGRRPLLFLGTAVFAILPFTYLGIASLGALITLRFVHGSATAIFGPVASAGISDIAPPDRRGTWLSTYSAVQGTGQALGPLIAGYLVATGGYDLAFVAAGLLALSTPLIAARWPAKRPTGAAAVPRDRFLQFAHGIAAVCREPLILATSLAQSAQFVLHGTMSAFLPLFARDVLGLTTSGIGWLFALQTATTLAARPVMGMASDRLGRRQIIVAGLTLCGAGVMVVSTAAGVLPLVAGVCTYAVGVAVTTAATSAFITDLASRAQYGTAHGVFGTIYDIGDALGPMLAGVLVASIGYGPMFRVMATIALAAAVTFHVVSRKAAHRGQPVNIGTPA